MNLDNISFPRTIEFHLFPGPQSLLLPRGNVSIKIKGNFSFQNSKEQSKYPKWAQPEL